MGIGNHVHKNGRKMHLAIAEDIKKAAEMGVKMTCCQIYVVGPRNNKQTLSNEEIDGIKRLTSDEANPIDVIVHSSYLSNPWGSKPEFGIHLIKKELEICDQIGAKGLVVHLAKRPREQIVEKLPELFVNSPVSIVYLEIESYKPSEGTYETPAKICRLFDEIKNRHPALLPKLGLCIDTAHLWAAGVDMSSDQLAKHWLDRVTCLDSISNVMFHLNDQIWALGAGRDQHAPLTYGTLWGAYNTTIGNKSSENSGLVEILQYIENKDIIAVLERHENEPKINGQPEISNILSDYMVINELGFFPLD